MTVIAQTSRDWKDDQRRVRVIRAAIDWVYNQNCSNALMELEDAVTALYGIPLDEARDVSSRKDKMGGR